MITERKALLEEGESRPVLGLCPAWNAADEAVYRSGGEYGRND